MCSSETIGQKCRTNCFYNNIKCHNVRTTQYTDSFVKIIKSKSMLVFIPEWEGDLTEAVPRGCQAVSRLKMYIGHKSRGTAKIELCASLCI
jgi:hypothetical protein